MPGRKIDEDVTSPFARIVRQCQRCRHAAVTRSPARPWEFCRQGRCHGRVETVRVDGEMFFKLKEARRLAKELRDG